MFLSKGYFLSKNCLREVVAAIERKKLVVLVHNADEEKGAPLRSRYERVPRGYQADVFPEGRSRSGTGSPTFKW